jgi:hypothetical protein
MSYQAQQLIKKAMQKAGIIAKSETPTNDELQDALIDLNMMLNSWSAENLMVFGTVQENFTLVDGTRTYTIGVGQTFNTAKPLRITGAFIRDSNNVDSGLDIIGPDLYDSYTDKAIGEGRPDVLNYDAGLTQQATPTGTISLYPIPDTAYTLYIDSYKYLTEIATINTTITLDKVYEEAIVYSLIPRIWREYHDNNEPIPLDLIEMAKLALNNVRRLNKERLVMATDLPTTPGHFNIYTGGYTS